VTLGDDVGLDDVAFGAAPGLKVEPQVRVGTDDPYAFPWDQAAQGTVDQEVAATVEPEAVKVDSQQR
jgi:hypothetical protein